MEQFKWHYRFLKLAEHISEWSQDPSTKVGAVITRPNKSICSVGYNGFPKGVRDYPARYHDRELKYKLIVHGELNSISFANESLIDYTLYTYPFLPCPRCAGPIIQSGITSVIAPEMPNELKGRWGEDIKLTKKMFSEAQIYYQELP